MTNIYLRTTATLLCLYCALAHAQQPQPTAAVPKLVRFSGIFRPANGPANVLPVQTMESVTLSVYRDQTGGDALWHEIQNIAVDSDGHYSVLMGATQNEGMPLDLFTSGEPRWLGTQFNRPGEAEQPRVLLVSVPYALKAADAETLGGKPASAYLLAAPAVGTDTAHETTSTTIAVKPKTTPANSGLPNYIGKFANTTDLVDSAMYEVNGNVGIFTTQPAISLDVRTGTLPQMGIAGTTDYLTFFASDQFGPAIYWDPAKDMRFGKGGSGLYNPYGFVEQMRIKSSNGNVGIGTQTPGSKLDVAGDVNIAGSILKNGGLFLHNVANSDTAVGLQALNPASTGFSNTAVGAVALGSNTSGVSNTAIGHIALRDNTSGNRNTAVGHATLLFNTESDNTAVGDSAIFSNTLGIQNTALGSGALANNSIGGLNTATGYYALERNQTGNNNTVIGYQALLNNQQGSNNIAIGGNAAVNVNVGNGNNIHIGNAGAAGDNGTIRIGAAEAHSSFFVAGVRAVTTGSNDAIPVLIDGNGQLGTASSSRRFKEDIADMGDASHDLMRLRPVTYRYKQPFSDGSKPIQYGLIAEEVAEVYPDLVAHSADGKIETVKYQVLDSMLLNEVQRQHGGWEISQLQQSCQSEVAAELVFMRSGGITMRNFQLRTTTILLESVYCANPANAQGLQPIATVPKLVRFSGSFRPANGQPAQTMESATLAVYRDQTGGDALWHEIQNVVVDADGHYSVLMGATQNEGMPLDLFASGEPRWLGAQFNRPGEAEQPRVLLVSVPYALKAADAETLGGSPAAAYLLAVPTRRDGHCAGIRVLGHRDRERHDRLKAQGHLPNSGLPNYIGKFADTNADQFGDVRGQRERRHLHDNAGNLSRCAHRRASADGNRGDYRLSDVLRFRPVWSGHLLGSCERHALRQRRLRAVQPLRICRADEDQIQQWQRGDWDADAGIEAGRGG